MKLYRIYVDTSVAGGCFDPEFRKDSLALFDLPRRGQAILLISSVLFQEVEEAPPEIMLFIERLPERYVELIRTNDESSRLRDRYVAERVVTKKYRQDAMHVATATIHRADVIVSWNFKHIVNIHRILGFNAVNARNGYPSIDIRTPTEVLPRDE